MTMVDRNKSSPFYPLTMAVLLVAPTAALSLTAHGADTLILEEVVVTARRRVEMELEVPLSVTVLTSEFLRKQNITELNDLGTQVPAMRISNAGTSTNQPIVTIRGQRPSDTALSLDQTVPIYLNEVVLTPSIGSNLSLYDLQSVQVLKGPQGTLFGRNSTGGALLLTTTAPGHAFDGYAEAKTGDYGLYGIEAGVNLPVNSSLQFRLSGRVLKRDGYQDNVANNSLAGRKKYWNEDSQALRLSMNVSSDNFTHLITASYDKNQIIGRLVAINGYNPDASLGQVLEPIWNGSLAALGLENYPTKNIIDNALARQKSRGGFEIETDVLTSDEVRNWFFTSTTEAELSQNLTFRSIFGYRDMQHEIALDADGSAIPLIGSLTAFDKNFTAAPEVQTTTAKQLSGEIQLIGDTYNEDLEWVTGFYYYQMLGRGSVTPGNIVGANPDWPKNGFGGPLAGLDAIALHGLTSVSTAGQVKNKAFGLYAEANYLFSEQISITLGFRLSIDDRSVTVISGKGVGNAFDNGINCTVQDETGTTLANDNCSRKVNQKYDRITGRTSFNYNPTDGMLLYLSAATGYRAGGFNFRDGTNAGLQPFDEETVVTFELGHKTDWGLVSNLPFSSKLSVYWQDYSDIQKTVAIQSAPGTFDAQTINAAQAVIKGVEVDFTWRPFSNAQFSLAYAYTHASYQEWDVIQNIAGALVSLDASDGEFVYVPKHSATGSISYSPPLANGLGEISLAATVYWQDEMSTTANPQLFATIGKLSGWSQSSISAAESTARVDSYEVLNLRFDWRNVLGSNYDLAVYSNNITDQEYVVGGLNIIESFGISALSYGPPKTIGASLRYSFD